MTEGEKCARAEGFCDGYTVGLIAVTALKMGYRDKWDQLADEYFANKALIPVPNTKGE